MTPIESFTMRTNHGSKKITRDQCPHPFCNVYRYPCEECGGWVSFCISHDQPTKNDRCTCEATR